MDRARLRNGAQGGWTWSCQSWEGVQGWIVVLHVGNFLLGALLQKWEKRSSHPVDAKDIDGEAVYEIIPEYG